MAQKDFLSMKLIAGSASLRIAEEISNRLQVPLTTASVKRFADGECQVQIEESVRACRVYIIQSMSAPVNDNLMELLLLISAAKRASPLEVIVVVPYLAYGRQASMPRFKRVPIAGSDVTMLIEAMGANRIVTLDLHYAQIQGFFSLRCPVDNLFAAPTAVSYFVAKDLVRPVVVSPDVAGVARAKLFLEALGVGYNVIAGFAVCYALEQAEGGPGLSTNNLVGDVAGRDCIVVDDMIDSGRTLVGCANELRAAGAARIFAFATHVLFKTETAENIEASAVDEVLVANTIDLPPNLRECTRKIRQISIGKLIEGALRAIHKGTSITELFRSNLSAQILPDVLLGASPPLPPEPSNMARPRSANRTNNNTALLDPPYWPTAPGLVKL